jgi:hypothetical protein
VAEVRVAVVATVVKEVKVDIAVASLMGVVREVVRSGPLLMGAGKDMADIKSIRKQVEK